LETILLSKQQSVQQEQFQDL